MWGVLLFSKKIPVREAVRRLYSWRLALFPFHTRFPGGDVFSWLALSGEFSPWIWSALSSLFLPRLPAPLRYSSPTYPCPEKGRGVCSTKTSTFCSITQSHFLIPGPSQRARGAAEQPDSVLCSSNPLPPALIHHQGHQAGGAHFQTAHT